MAKKPMYYTRLYEVRLDDGAQNHTNYMAYVNNVVPFNPKAVDLGGGNYHAMIKHHVDADTLHMLLTMGFKKGTEDQLTVREVTKKSLKSYHIVYEEMVQTRFLNFDTFPNISG